MRAAVRPEQVLRGTPETAFSCLYYAVMNFFVWAGVEPPSLDDLRATATHHLGAQAARIDEPEDPVEWAGIGINLAHVLMLLSEFNFPRLAALAVITKGRTAREVFPSLLERGYGVLFGWRLDLYGRQMAHAGVACGWSGEWVEVMDSNPAFFTGRVVPFVDDGLAFDREEIEASLLLPHGAVSRLEWLTLPEDAPPHVAGAPAAGVVGIERVFVLALPPEVSL